MIYLTDTNVLIRWSLAEDPSHDLCSAAVRRLLSARNDVCACAQVLIEYWVALTRPREVNDFGLTAADAAARFLTITNAFPILPEPPDIADQWLKLAIEHGVCGKQAHDARLAALMLAHGVTHILTLNPRDFARYDGITPVTPQEIHQTP